MNHKGYIEANFDNLEALLTAVIRQLDSPKTRLALWLIEAFDFSPVESIPIGRESPLVNSNSQLAGFGQLFNFSAVNPEQLSIMLTAEDHLACEIMHLEIEAQGSVQFAAYDNFGYVSFGDGISLHWLQTLKAQGIIADYQLSG
ncbi:MAG: hypothetical protein O2890_13075 [Cyanobacteria bacterium]|nr:hypothetical protein [Cyanobacteriota bacterium]MDA0867321.1 hypothetical protein [Cyanobacteriota bacterium]